jgi:hypothetical protein
MADIDAGAAAPEVKRYTVLGFMAMLGASLVALAIGLAGALLLVPNLMGFAPAMGGDQLVFAVFLFMSAGPFVAGLALIIGWIAFTMLGAPRTGRKLVFYPPVIWGVLLLAYLAVVSTACDGQWTCGL